MTRKEDPRLQGRTPEFAIMSNRPGIGAGAIRTIADDLLSVAGRRYLDQAQDVPSALRTGGKLLPLGRYLKEQLRGHVIRAGAILAVQGDTPQARLYQAQMLAMRQAAKPGPLGPRTLAEAIELSFQGRRAALEARERFSKEKRL